jgi:hypothetical protein
MLSIACVCALSFQCIKNCIDIVSLKVLFGAIALSFLPLGYIISVISQTLYLGCKKHGIHIAAKNKAGVNFLDNPQDEPTLEALSLMLTLERRLSLKEHIFLQDWVRKRMDVLAINSSLIISTVLALLFAPLISIVYFQCSPQIINFNVIFLIIVSGSIIAVLYRNSTLLRRQVIKVIAETYEKFK